MIGFVTVEKMTKVHLSLFSFKVTHLVHSYNAKNT